MKLVSGLAYKSSEISDPPTYDAVASEYYDEVLHPTCADFRLASSIYLNGLFEAFKPAGLIADVGCGRSLIADFSKAQLVLIDKSAEMLRQNSSSFEARLLDIEREPIGNSEFDWIFSVLGDPYNRPEVWRNITVALKMGGQCVFIVPSSEWARQFRLEALDERPEFARFVTSEGKVIFLPSLIVEPEDQRRMIADAGLELVAMEHVSVEDLPYLRSPKVSGVLSAGQHLLDIYRAKKP